MAKSQKKAAKKVKAQAQVEAAVAQVVGTGANLEVQMYAPKEAPVLGSEGIDWEALYAEVEAEEHAKTLTLVNDSKDTIIVTVNQEQFNRAGFDALMNAGLGSDVKKAIVEAAPEKKTVRARINDGFLGETRRMYRAGKNGQEILTWNSNARIAAGYDKEHAMIRAKKDYGYVIREAKATAKAEAAKKAEAAHAETAVAV